MKNEKAITRSPEEEYLQYRKTLHSMPYVQTVIIIIYNYVKCPTNYNFFDIRSYIFRSS